MKLKNDLQMSMLIITHDISLAETICDSVVIMYAGQILEINNYFFQKAFHPYSKSFLMSLPSMYQLNQDVMVRCFLYAER